MMTQFQKEVSVVAMLLVFSFAFSCSVEIVPIEKARVKTILKGIVYQTDSTKTDNCVKTCESN